MEFFGRAKTAKEKYMNSEVDEQTQVSKATNQIDGYVDGNRGTVTLSEEEYNKLLRKGSYKFKSSESITLPYTATEPCAVFIFANTGNATWKTFNIKINGFDVLIEGSNEKYGYNSGLFFLEKDDVISFENNGSGNLDIVTLYKY